MAKRCCICGVSGKAVPLYTHKEDKSYCSYHREVEVKRVKTQVKTKIDKRRMNRAVLQVIKDARENIHGVPRYTEEELLNYFKYEAKKAMKGEDK